MDRMIQQKDVRVPISVGELIDKITILRIKQRRIADVQKKANVEKELTALLAVCREQSLDASSALAKELEQVNEDLWVIEDDIRDKERAQAFDAEFVRLARAVYQTNDRRFAVKARINAESGSAYREEKSYKDYGGAVKFLLPFVIGLAALMGLDSPAAANHVDRWYTHADDSPAPVLSKTMGNEVVYQIFVDRFANGNTTNDCLFDARYCDPSRRDFYRFWGGDLRGLVGKLDYLKGLGVTRLWLTPIFENEMITKRRIRYGAEIEMAPYHGYWIRDWYRLNPFFTDQGTKDFALVEELVNKAQPEIGILLDTVVNHTSPADRTPWSDQVARSEPGSLFKDGVFVASMTDDDRRAEGDKRFHHYGWISDYDNLFQVENYQLDGLSDLNQDHPVVRQYMDEAHAFWMTRFPNLAGFRMDTIKHVHHAYWRQFDQTFFGAFPEAEIVGEYFSGGPHHALSRKFYKETRQSMFDFNFRDAIEAAFLRNESLRVFSSLWNADPQLIDARALVTFVDNHDIARLRGKGMSAQAMRQAIALMFLSRGIPSVYYGMEQDLFTPGDRGDPYNRPMMTSFDPGHPLYQMIARLTRLRKENAAPRYGKTHVIHESDHILAFERVYHDDYAFFAMSKNDPAGGADRFTMQGLTLPDGEYTDVLSGKVYRVNGGKMPVALAKGDVIVLSRP